MKNENQVVDSGEIKLQDIVEFFRRNLRLIAIFGVVGLFLSIIYLVQKPEKYEAQLQIQLAQFVNSNNNIIIEEPATLILRLRGPTIYPVDVQQSCGIPEGGEFGDYIGGALKIEAIKGLASAVELKISGPSSNQARQCAESIFAMIVTHQRSLIEDRLAGRQSQLAQYQKAFRDEVQQLERIKNSELGNFAYLAKLDKLSWLRTRIDALQEEATLSRLHPAKLIAPMYVPKKPVSHKVGLMLSLVGGLGLILGVLYALGREAWRRAA